MEVFSSLETTYSSSPSGTPSNVRAYRSRTRWALARKLGSRMKIQDRYCQGLRASSRSQRRTVDAETVSVIPRAVSSAASSGQDQCDSGTPVSAGSWQASALASATCTGVKRRDARSVCSRPGPAARHGRTGRATDAPCPGASPSLGRSGHWSDPARRGVRPAPVSGPGEGSCDRRPPSSGAAFARRSGISGGRRQRARQASRSAEVDLNCGSLPTPSTATGLDGCMPDMPESAKAPLAQKLPTSPGSATGVRGCSPAPPPCSTGSASGALAEAMRSWVPPPVSAGRCSGRPG